MEWNSSTRAAAAALLGVVFSEAYSAGSDLYSCVSAGGQRISRDRPITECSDVDQMLRRADGTTVRVPPAETEDERSRRIASEEQKTADSLKARRQAMADRELLARFPNESAHAIKRADALAGVQTSIRGSEARIRDLVAEHAKLMLEREFYPPPLKEPVTLTLKVDANEAAVAAQRALLANQRIEASRISASTDEELARLRVLWAVDQVSRSPSQ